MLSRSPTPCQNFSRRRVRPGVRPDVRADVRATRVSSAAPKTKSFDRGGPVWPPRSNVTNDRLGGVWGGFCPASPKLGGLRGSAPQPKIFRKFSIFLKIIFSRYTVSGTRSGPGDHCCCCHCRWHHVCEGALYVLCRAEWSMIYKTGAMSIGCYHQNKKKKLNFSR